VIGIDPGGTTGWARITVPRDSIYGHSTPEIITLEQGQWQGSEEQQTLAICRYVRGTQSLDYGVGPAIVVEDFTLGIKNPTTDARTLLSPVRLAAMLRYALYRGDMSEGPRIVLQNRSFKRDMTDDDLRRRDLYFPGEEHARDALRHALVALRRARETPRFRDELWNHVAGERKET